MRIDIEIIIGKVPDIFGEMTRKPRWMEKEKERKHKLSYLGNRAVTRLLQSLVSGSIYCLTCVPVFIILLSRPGSCFFLPSSPLPNGTAHQFCSVLSAASTGPSPHRKTIRFRLSRSRSGMPARRSNTGPHGEDCIFSINTIFWMREGTPQDISALLKRRNFKLSKCNLDTSWALEKCAQELLRLRQIFAVGFCSLEFGALTDQQIPQQGQLECKRELGCCERACGCCVRPRQGRNGRRAKCHY